MTKTVIITGASSGLGLTLAKRFSSLGYTVYGSSLTKRNWKSANKAVSFNEHFFLHQVNLTSEHSVKRYIRNIWKKEKKIGVLINSAGYSNIPSRVEKHSLKEFQKNLGTNLVSAFLTSKYSIPFFQKQKAGLIINVSSMAGKRAVPCLVGYSASKFGVLALSQCVAKENAESNLKCVTVCPGGMNTQMRAKLFGKKDASLQQSTDFVADIMIKVIMGEIKVLSGGDIVIRHSKITAINPPPKA